MRILVTGSSGSIGAAVAARLRQDAEVAGLDLLPGPETTQIGDILDTELVGRMLRDVSAVVHTAALHIPHLARSTDADFLRVNQEGTRVLLQAAAARGVGRFVYTSTTSVYGCSERVGPPATWADESLPPQPADAYDRTKLAAEALCRDAADHRMTTVILRMSRCFPEPDHLVAFYRMYRGVDRRDVAEAHYHAVVAQVPGSVTVNVSAATPFRPADLAVLWNDPWHVIDRHLPGVRAAFEQRRWPLPSRVDRVYPVSNAARVLGFAPRFGIEWLLGC